MFKRSLLFSTFVLMLSFSAAYAAGTNSCSQCSDNA